jgi:predicted nucleotidyltransferase
MNYFTGLQRFEQKDGGWPNNEDKVIFNIAKFVNLASKANPNLLDLFFTPEDCILTSTPAWEKLVGIRDLFLTKKVKFTYSGYAFSQIQRVKTHRRWLLDPPKHEPTREEFGLSGKRMSKEFDGLLETFDAGKREERAEIEDVPAELQSAMWQRFEAERRWRHARKEWESYQNWQKNRNPVRAALEAKYGFDCKHGSHCVRLMLQGLDILRGQFTSARLNLEQQELCRGIKQGMWTYDRLMEETSKYMAEFDVAYKVSKLPHSPDLDKIEAVLMTIVDEVNYPERTKP